MSNLLKNIESIIDQSMQVNKIPGAAVAVIKNKEIILSKGYGKTNIEEWASPVHSHTLFRIASVSKLFTGTLMMMLVEKGLVDLDQPVTFYVPWFTTANPDLSKEITIRMLLSHSSGLPTGGELSNHHQENGLLRYMKETVPSLPILFQPGTAYSYGNHGLNIAGFVAEQVTNQTFESLIQEMLFDSLEMTQTTYNPLKAMTYSLALPHDKDQEGNLIISHQFFDNTASYPSYYAFSSIEDLCKFAMMHLEDGVYKDNQIISLQSIEEMRTQQSKWYTLTDAGCGINFFKETKNGIDRYWHYGQYSHQYSSQFILVPDEGIAVIALANGENIFQAGYEIIDELLKETSYIADEGLNTIPAEEPDWSSFIGTYLHSYYGLFEISVQSNKMFLSNNERSFELIYALPNTYLAKDDQGQTAFTVGIPTPKSNQSIRCIMVNSNACPEFKQTYSPNPNDWVDWLGSYSDGRETYVAMIKDDHLIIKDMQNHSELKANAIAENQFLTKEYGLISFINVNETIHLEFGFAWRFPKIAGTI